MRKQFTRIIAAALLAVAGVAAPAQAQDAKAADVLARTRKALGDKKLEALKALSLEAAMDRNVGTMQMSSAIEMFLELPDKYLRAETSRMGMAINSGFNGDKAILPANMSMAGGGAMVFRMGPGGPTHGDAAKLTPEQKAEIGRASLRSARTDVSRMMLGWFGMAHPSLGAAYTYAGEAESPDGKAHVIDVKDSDGFAARLFIDQNNFLPLMVTYQARAPRVMTSGGPMAMTRTAPAAGAPPAGAAAPTRELTDEERKKMAADLEKQATRQMAAQPLANFTLFFDDWREVDGLTFPHKMRKATDGETTEEWTFAKVKVNPKIDAAKFDVSRDEK